jgi:metabolite-proton symporter
VASGPVEQLRQETGMSEQQSRQIRVGEARRVAVASAIGTTVEWYDFFIYGTAAALVFGPMFFPQASELAGTLAAFATFAVGFVARPLGGVVMGHFGDRVGRKSMLVWSLMLMGVATVGIGLLPTYEQIGVWAPTLLVSLRFIQGFGLGGEWGGAALMAVEHAPKGRRGFYGSFVALGLPVGIIASNVVFLAVSATASEAQLASWAWRLPFLFSAVMVGVGLFVRLRVAESPVFAQVQKSNAERRIPILDVVRANPRAVLLAAGSYLGLGGLGYIVIVYFVSYATEVLGLSVTSTLMIITVASVLFAGSIFASAVWSDRLGRRRVMGWGCVAMAVWSCVFFPLADTGSMPLIALAVLVMLTLQGTYIGPQPAIFAELFPASMRYSGVSISVQLGTILGGGLVPFIATALYGIAGDSWPVTIYTVVLALIALVCVVGLGETYERDLSHAQDTSPNGANQRTTAGAGARAVTRHSE